MRRLIWSLGSVRDLRGIDGFLAAVNPSAALRILRAIRERAQQLRAYPNSGPVLRGDLRYLSVRNTPYILIYRIAADQIEVVRIRHAREDWRPE